MQSGFYIRLKGRSLLDLSKKKKINRHGVSMAAGVSAPTIYRYFAKDTEGLKFLDLDNFPKIMIDGLGMSTKDFMNLKLKDLFNLLEEAAE